MPTSKITDLADISTNLTDGDLIPVVNSPPTGTSSKATITRVRQQCGGLLAYVLVPVVADATTSSTSFVDVSTGNVQATFTAPPSGKVLVRYYFLGQGANLVVGIHDGTADVSGSSQVMTTDANPFHITYAHVLQSLTPGTSYTIKMRFRATAGSVSITLNGAPYVSFIEVWSIPQ